MSRSIETVVLLISMFCCTSFAVYYTTGPQLDYPRLGKRNFYTEGTIFPVNEDDAILMSDPAIPVIANLNRRGIFTNTQSKGIVSNGKRNAFVARRGFFTRGSSDYPRIGKREEKKNKNENRMMGIYTNTEGRGIPTVGRSDNFWSDGVNQAYQKVKEVKDDVEEEAEQVPSGSLMPAISPGCRLRLLMFSLTRLTPITMGNYPRKNFRKACRS